MEESTPGKETKSSVDKPESEAARGDADAVNDTPDIARHATTPGSLFRVVSPTPPATGGNKLIWLAVIVALGLILAYAAGMLR